MTALARLLARLLPPPLRRRPAPDDRAIRAEVARIMAMAQRIEARARAEMDAR